MLKKKIQWEQSLWCQFEKQLNNEMKIILQVFSLVTFGWSAKVKCIKTDICAVNF